MPRGLLNLFESIEIRRYQPELNSSFGPLGTVARQIELWLGRLPELGELLVGPWDTLADAWNAGTEMWLDEEGSLGCRHPLHERADDVSAAMKWFEDQFA